MATNYALLREVELAILAESTYGTSPGTPVGADFFKHQSRLHITPVQARARRDRDGDYQQASVLQAPQKGRSMSNLKIDCEVIPSGNASTITAPDTDLLWKTHFGTSHAATAHTTLTSGSTTTSLVLTAGGGAASGVAVGDIVAVDVSAAFGYEVARVTAVATDTLTIAQTLSAAPATGRTVKLGTTYKFLNTSVLSLYLWQWIAGNLARHAVPGVILPNLELSCNMDQDVPMLMSSFAGMGMEEVTHAVSHPTASVAGKALVPTQAKLWMGAAKFELVGFNLKSDSGAALRKNEGGSLQPSGAKRTGNLGRYKVDLTLDIMYSTGDRDSAAMYDLLKTLNVYDTMIQIGIVPGQMVAINAPKFYPDGQRSEQDGEFGFNMAGECLGTTGDDELFVTFL